MVTYGDRRIVVLAIVRDSDHSGERGGDVVRLVGVGKALSVQQTRHVFAILVRPVEGIFRCGHLASVLGGLDFELGNMETRIVQKHTSVRIRTSTSRQKGLTDHATEFLP